MNRIFILFHGRFPSEKAASLFTAKGAEAFALAGREVVVAAPRRRGAAEKDPFDFYGIERNFKVVYLPVIDLFGILPNRMAFFISFVVFSVSSFLYVKRESTNEDVIYSNETLPLLLIAHIRRNCFFEMHDFPESKFGAFARLLRKVRWVLVHNKWKMAEAERRFPDIPREKFLYEPNAVDLDDFDVKTSKSEARAVLGLPNEKVIVVYTGHLYAWKGVDTLAWATESLSDFYKTIFVGGTHNDVESFKKRYGDWPKLSIAGHRPHKEIPLWQKAADILILPNTGRVAISSHYTSPMKLYEYMASKRPIVATDIPSIREIIDSDNAVLVPPDDPEALAEAIDSLARDPKRGERLAAQAFSDVSTHTWQARAGRILAFIEKNK